MNKPFFKIDLFGNEISQNKIEPKKIVIPEYTQVTFNDFEFLSCIKDNDVITIDIETTGLKPHKKGHKIICISITKDNKTVVFNEFPDILHTILKNENIKKIAHNCKFENNWIKCIWGYWIQGWYWDTMLAAHILDNVSRCGLKYLVQINFDIVDYDINIKKYLKADSSNDFNKIEECNQEDIMKYCGYDTYFTNKLYKKQKLKLIRDKHLKKGFDFFMEAQIHFSYIQNNGFCFDKDMYDKNCEELNTKLLELDSLIQNSQEVKKLNSTEKFNFNSTKQLRHLLFDVLKLNSIKKTNTNANSVDVEVLAKLNTDFSNNILKYRYFAKIKDTYLKQFMNEYAETEKGNYIYPFFNLQTTDTYRSSASNPNVQNIPSRDIFARTKTRECLIPSNGNQLLEVDFRGMEVAIGTCYHLDKNMINYIINQNNDMHRDVAALIFMKSKKDINKKERFCAKNGFVFPSFYGSTSRMYNDNLKEKGFGELTYNLYELLDIDMKEYLKSKNILNIFEFQNHIEKIEYKFWKETFPEYQQWKFDNWRDYKEKSYVELFTGFRCIGKMGFNQVNNYRIQGTAFHVMLWCLIELNKYLIENNFKTKIIGQIHDSIIMDINPTELEELKPIIKDICTVKVRENFKWIVVPLQIEAEITGINESWNLKKEFII